MHSTILGTEQVFSMLSNRALTALTFFGLALPLILLGMRQLDAWVGYDPSACEYLTATLETKDNVARLPYAPVLVVGSTLATEWPTTIRRLDSKPALVRGVPGLDTIGIRSCFSRVIGFYRPSTVILMLDASDVGKLETELRENLRGIGNAMNNLHTEMSLLVTGFLHTPARDNRRVDRLNQAVAAETALLSHVEFIDFNPLFTAEAGDDQPDPKFFWPDGDTLAEGSYGAIADALTVRIQAQTAAVPGVMMSK